MKTEKKKNVIEIQEDVRIPNSDIILEKGDKIKVIEKTPLKEGVSKVVFHATQVRKAINILQSNEFVLTSNLGTSADQIGANKFYYFSVSRVKWGGYNRGIFGEKTLGVILELDGDKFNQRYKGGPVDYWGPNFRTPDIPKEDRLRSDENEERVFSDDPLIPRASSYVLAVHAYIPEREEEHEYDDLKKKRKLIEVTSTRRLPLYIYKNFSDFKVLNTQKAEDKEQRVSSIDTFVDTLQAIIDGDLKKAHSLNYDLTSGLIRAKEYNIPIADIVKDRFDPLQELIRSIEIDIHNLRSSEKFLQEPIHRLTQFMRKFKTKSMAELLQAVVNTMKL